MKRKSRALARVVAFTVLLLGSNMIAAREDDPTKPSESTAQPSPVLEVQKNPDDISEGPEGYHPEGRRIGTPTDVDRDLEEPPIWGVQDVGSLWAQAGLSPKKTPWTASSGPRPIGSFSCCRVSKLLRARR